MEKTEMEQIAKMISDLEKRLEKRLEKTDQNVDDTKREIMTYIESSVERDIKIIAEGVSTLVNRKPSIDDVAENIEKLDIRVSATEAVLKTHRAELNELEKAQ